TFTTGNWWVAQVVTVSADPAFTPPAGEQPTKEFPIAQHSTSKIQGPLFIEGFVGAGADRSLVRAITLPNEIDPPLPVINVGNTDESKNIDTLNIRNDSNPANLTGEMNDVTYANGDYGINVSGLGMSKAPLEFDLGATKLSFAPGITFRDIEVAEVLLGYGDDKFTVNDTLRTSAQHGGLTVIHGGGNTSATTGDTITVNRQASTNDSALLIYGDTSQDGTRYSGKSGEKSVNGISFDFDGRDTIDASKSNVTLAIYGGGNNDTLTGSQAGDNIAGGSGDDTIKGEGGVDHLYGDSGININLATRVLSVPTSNESKHPNADNLAVGNDTIHAGTGLDIVLGDHGVIDQSAGTLRILNTGNVTRVATMRFGEGGNDVINGNEDRDLLIGGFGEDKIHGNAADDVAIGDNAEVTYLAGAISFASTSSKAAGDPSLGSADTIDGDEGEDVLIGGAAGDTISGNLGNDIAIGDNAEVLFGSVRKVETTARTAGGADTIRGNEGEDVLIGGAAGDKIDGNTERDLIFGDNVLLDRVVPTADANQNPRFRTLSASQLYTTGTNDGGAVNVNTAAQNQPGTRPVWEDFAITLQDHSAKDETAKLNNFGNDYIAGGSEDDQIFGQLGDDVIQGDGSIDLAVSAVRTAAGLAVSASVEDYAGAGKDGRDYIEGNGGNDVIFGNLGQDDIVGGSSSLFSLMDRTQRPDGSDLIFGGAGTDISRNNESDVHGRDADMILGDNGNILRIVTVGTGGATAYQSFTYDDTYGEQIVVRAAQLLDDTPGGVARGSEALDIGAGDELHGESGDDFIYGMRGNDVLFGEGHDDDLIGGYGNDWISGGTGQDGVLGDDG